MNIINILLSDKKGGVEQSFVKYCQILKNLNHRVLAVVKIGAPYIPDLKKLNIDIIEIDNKFGYYDFFAIKEISNLIKEFEAKLIFAHVGRAMILSKKALKKFSDIPLIAVNHSNNVKRSIGADIVLSVNDVIRSKTINMGQNSEKSFVIPNAIDFKKSDLKNCPIKTFGKKITIGTLGRLSHEKSFGQLISAINILKSKGYKIKLKIAGSGSEERNLRSLVLDLKLDQEIEFLDWIDDKEKLFSEIDIFCLPSSQETFGIVLLEAMRYNTPVIATNCDGPKTIIKDGVNGILIEKEPIDSLPSKIADSIIRLIGDEKLVEKLVINAQKSLIENYSLEAVQEKVKEVIDLATVS